MMKIYMTEYKVKGIKTLDQLVSLSFYKKTISKPINTRDYNIKGIYGMNGSGKSGIVTSIDIMRKILINEDYLNNPIVQKNLDSLINKKTQTLYMEIEYLIDMSNDPMLYRHTIVLEKSKTGKYIIGKEKLSVKRAISRKEEFDPLIEVVNGEIKYISRKNNDVLPDIYEKKSVNLLSTSSVSSLFMQKVFIPKVIDMEGAVSFLYISFLILFALGNSIFVFMDQSDDHTDYALYNILEQIKDIDEINKMSDFLMQSVRAIDKSHPNIFSISTNYVRKTSYEDFKDNVAKLEEFIRIFKSDLVKIDIDRKEHDYGYACNLIMMYENYSINTEFESTGIKKLIRLFTYLKEMVQGNIVFIDEFDSNIHDVYLCALLEYLMDYGEGQLCFTTHNVGPMDVLKIHKKSIDFLSFDHKIYPWTSNGNYSPSKLYRSGMIEGSPFNVDSIDFIGVFDSLEEEDV